MTLDNTANLFNMHANGYFFIEPVLTNMWMQLLINCQERIVMFHWRDQRTLCLRNLINEITERADVIFVEIRIILMSLCLDFESLHKYHVLTF